MKRLFIAISAVALLFSACNKADQFKINGKLEGKADGKIYLAKVQDNKLEKIDSTTLVEGAFTFVGKVESPERYFIQLEGERSAIQFFVENSEITINANVENLNDAKVVGSAENDVYVAYGESQKEFKAKNEALYAEYQKAVKEKNEAAVDSIRNVAMKMEEEKAAATKEFVKNNANSVVSGYIAVRMISGMEIPEMEETYNALGENVKASTYGTMIKERIDILKKVAIGQPAPDFTLNTPEGTPMSLSSLKGKVVVIDFWASWCGPCRRENPHMVELYKELHGQGVEFLGVSLDNDKEAWLKAIEKDGLVWNHVSDLAGWNSAAAKLYGVRGIPATVVIDKDGNISAKKVFGPELKAAVEKAL